MALPNLSSGKSCVSTSRGLPSEDRFAPHFCGFPALPSSSYPPRQRAGPALASHDPAIDMLELGVPIRVLFAFPRLAIGLQAVSLPLQELTHLRMANLKALAFQFAGQRPCALTSPPQRRHRIASRRGLYQNLHGAYQLWLFLFPCRATGPGPSLTIRGKRVCRPRVP